MARAAQDFWTFCTELKFTWPKISVQQPNTGSRRMLRRMMAHEIELAAGYGFDAGVANIRAPFQITESSLLDFPIHGFVRFSR
ncbi:MAG: hypothetical protein DWI00_05335 [Planctomycetota bacterium]|nr:MAG: hypothetical protein DWI00_05335 [Planctomycetota bacterium]